MLTSVILPPTSCCAVGGGRLCPFDLQGHNKSLSLSSSLPGALFLPSAPVNQSLPVAHSSQGLVGLPRASVLEQAVAVGLPGAPLFNAGILDLKTPCLMGRLQRLEREPEIFWHQT